MALWYIDHISCIFCRSWPFDPAEAPWELWGGHSQHPGQPGGTETGEAADHVPGEPGGQVTEPVGGPWPLTQPQPAVRGLPEERQTCKCHSESEVNILIIKCETCVLIL